MEAPLHQLFDRSPDANKYDFGHILIVGGSPGMMGAPYLAAMAALRSGSGLVTIASSSDVARDLDRNAEEIMTLALPQDANETVHLLTVFIKERHVNTVVIGPGLRDDAAELCKRLLANLHVPVVVDAGALVAYRGHLGDLQKIAHNTTVVITPHTGEYEKLTLTKLPQSKKAVAQSVSETAKQLSATIVLKGANTLVAHPDGSVHRNQTGNPGLATAGTGDVLTGVIAALLAQDIPVGEAAEGGVYLHGLAGDLASKAKTEPGMIASDVIDFLPEALKQVSGM